MPTALEEWKVMPHDDLVEIDDGILTVAGEIEMPLGHFPRRMTVVRLSGDRSLIFSAIALETEAMRRIEAMGWPHFLVVPSGFHRLDARIWKQRYPPINVVAPPGARAAVAEVVPVDATDDIFEDEAVRLLAVPGTGGREAALEVRRGGRLTVIVNDVIANVAHPHGFGAQVMGRLFGFGVSEPQVPWVVKRKAVEQPAALAGQFRAWADAPELARIVMSHGDLIEDEPAAVLRRLADGLASLA